MALLIEFIDPFFLLLLLLLNHVLLIRVSRCLVQPGIDNSFWTLFRAFIRLIRGLLIFVGNLILSSSDILQLFMVDRHIRYFNLLQCAHGPDRVPIGYAFILLFIDLLLGVFC